eukprot:4450304-Amphidinium_carterae.1
MYANGLVGVYDRLTDSSKARGHHVRNQAKRLGCKTNKVQEKQVVWLRNGVARQEASSNRYNICLSYYPSHGLVPGNGCFAATKRSA